MPKFKQKVSLRNPQQDSNLRPHVSQFFHQYWNKLCFFGRAPHGIVGLHVDDLLFEKSSTLNPGLIFIDESLQDIKRNSGNSRFLSPIPGSSQDRMVGGPSILLIFCLYPLFFHTKYSYEYMLYRKNYPEIGQKTKR